MIHRVVLTIILVSGCNIIVEVMARLHAENFNRLKLYVETRRTSPNLKFKTWLRVVAKRVGIDYLRGHQNYIDRRRDPDRGSAPGEWIEAGTLPSQSKLPGERPPMTARGTALELLRYAAGAVPEPGMLLAARDHDRRRRGLAAEQRVSTP